jgi:rod shape-determining protein MreC
VNLAARVGEYFSTQAQLVADNEQLRAKALAYAQDAQRYQAAQAETEQLRRLIGAVERLAVLATPAEVLYVGRDPYSHKLFIDRGAAQGVRPGSPVADEEGVIGQVTRVHPLVSEVTLLTDRDHAIPVQVVRNGLRAVAFGGGASGMLELRFMSAVSDIQNGDRLVTSGIDGTYPAGLPVANVVRIERDAEQTFARALCQPVAGIDRGRYVLILANEASRPPLPEDAGRERARKQKPRSKKDAKEADAAR